MGDRGRKTQSQPRTRFPSGSVPAARSAGTARPRSPSGMPGPRSDTLSLIRSPSPLALTSDISGCAVGLQLVGARVFDGIVDKIGQRLGSPVRGCRAPAGLTPASILRVQSLVVSERSIKLTHAARDVGGVELGHRRAGLGLIGARNHQQCVEGTDQFVGFLDCRLERRAIIGSHPCPDRTPLRRDCEGASAGS